MTSEDTAPEVQTGACGDDRSLGLLWVWPEERFLPLTGRTVTVGRGSGASALTGTRVSRRHATITNTAESLVLRDEGSRNGTRLNGELIREARLRTGDVVRLADWLGVVVAMPAKIALSRCPFRETETGVALGPSTQGLWQRTVELARCVLPVLLQAPTGAGKEVFARALHQFSERPGRFVAQNCAALPESLAEAQLFGHERGAFTGAQTAAQGLFLAADGGTLLLDEVTDLPQSQQAKLLRVVEQGEVTPLGTTISRRVDVRLVAACQTPLSERAARGEFRSDLYARLCGATLVIPSIRERREEVPRLFTKFLREYGGSDAMLDAAVVETLLLHDWPLNVREVRLAAQALAAEYGSTAADPSAVGHFLRSRFASTGGPAAGSTPPSGACPAPKANMRRAAWLLRNFERLKALHLAVGNCEGNLSRAAREVGISRQRALRLLEAEREHVDAREPGN